MKSEYKELAKQAGFIFWANEDWKPDDAVIDWSCDYDKELEKLIELVIEKYGKWHRVSVGQE